MNEEIIKIIKDLEFCKGIFDYTMAPEQCGLLLNYINNLQQENYQLAEKVINQRHALCDTNKKIQVLNARIEKAFKYIDYYVRIDDEHYENLKEILKGEENEKRN